jgi:hypothetical protein
MTADGPAVTVDRDGSRTRITIESSRPGASVTVDLPPDVVIPNGRGRACGEADGAAV